MAIDLTKGSLEDRLDLQKLGIPCWRDFSIGRIREAAKVELPTSGHLISHNPEEMRDALAEQDLSHMLVLDDTSFSGSTSLIVEGLVRSAFQEADIKFTHGFLILNNGQLGPAPGAKQRLAAAGSQTIEGMNMNTPKDDGWHIFDLVKQHDLQNHLQAVRELLAILGNDDFKHLVTAFLADQETLRTLFPNLLTTEELESRRKVGHFIAVRQLNGDFHVHNPQLMPNIIAQGHLLPPEQWVAGQDRTFDLLEQIGKLVDKGDK